MLNKGIRAKVEELNAEFGSIQIPAKLSKYFEEMLVDRISLETDMVAETDYSVIDSYYARCCRASALAMFRDFRSKDKAGISLQNKDVPVLVLAFDSYIGAGDDDPLTGKWVDEISVILAPFKSVSGRFEKIRYALLKKLGSTRDSGNFYELVALLER